MGKKRKSSKAIETDGAATAATSSSKKPRREVEVVVFEDPVERILRQKAKRHQELIARKPKKDDHDLKFALSLEEITALGASQLKGKAKKAYEQQRIEQLGGKAPKNEKVPYHILQGKRRKHKELTIVRREKDLAMGIVNKKKKPTVEKPRTGRGQHWVDRSSIEDTRMRKGVLRVSAKPGGKRS